jgi:hypothetical protein
MIFEELGASYGQTIVELEAEIESYVTNHEGHPLRSVDRGEERLFP